MKNKNKLKVKRNRRGSMLVGALLALLMVAAISLAIAKRAATGLNISIDSGKSYGAYQESDASAEKILTAIRNFDDDSVNDKKIPENVSAEDLCGTLGCLKEGEAPTNSNTKLSDVARVKQSGEEGDSARAVSVPLPERIANVLDSGVLEVHQCGVAGSPPGCGATGSEKCGVEIRWKKDDADIDDALVRSVVVRRSTNKELSNGSGYGWVFPTNNVCPAKVEGGGGSDHDSKSCEVPVDEIGYYSDGGTDYNYIAVQNWNDPDLFDGTSDPKYYFAVKLKSKKNFTLDSFYAKTEGVTLSGCTINN